MYHFLFQYGYLTSILLGVPKKTGLIDCYFVHNLAKNLLFYFGDMFGIQ